MKADKRPLFTAITFGLPTRDYLMRMSEQLDQYVLATGSHPEPAENLHLTLTYLPAAQASDRLVAQLAAICLPAFTLRVAAPGMFDNAEGDVIWAGVDGETTRLHQLKQAIDGACGAAGYPVEPREYRPHITLAYAKTARLKAPPGAPRPGGAAPTFTVDRFHLFRVEREPSEFRLLHSFPLQPASGG